MRFGLFVPQGWRLDLVGIDPADQWPVMRDLALRRPRAVGLDLGLRPFPHLSRAHRRGHPRGVVADVGVRRGHRARAPGSDVHRDELPQPRIPREGRRDRRHHRRRPHRHGHRRRLVRAGVARLATGSRRRASGSAAWTRAYRSSSRRGPPAPPRSTAATTRSTARSCVHFRCRTAESRCGSPVAARR